MLSPVQKTTNHLCPQHFTQAHFYVPISIMIFHTPCLTTSHTLTLIHTRMLSLHTLYIVQPVLTCECPHLHNSLLPVVYIKILYNSPVHQRPSYTLIPHLGFPISANHTFSRIPSLRVLSLH